MNTATKSNSKSTPPPQESYMTRLLRANRKSICLCILGGCIGFLFENVATGFAVALGIIAFATLIG